VVQAQNRCRKEISTKSGKTNKQDKVNKYKQKVIQHLETEEIPTETNKKWEFTTNIIKRTAMEILGKKPQNKNINIHENEEIKNMSNEQKKLKLELESVKNVQARKEIRKKRNNIRNKIKIKLGSIEEVKMEEDLMKIERKEGNQKAHEAVKTIKRLKPSKALKIFDKQERMVSSEKRKVDLVTEHFKIIFEKQKQEPIKHYPPCTNNPPFDENEIEKATKKLKNGKSTGEDEISAELLKHAPKEIHKLMAQILNQSVESDDYLETLKTGILNILQKPPKKGMEKKINVRPIILLSIIRKVMSICVIG